jgi:hypothetical protein
MNPLITQMAKLRGDFKKIFLPAILLLGVAITGCQPGERTGFAIYLLDQPVSTSQLSQIDLGELSLQNKPIVSGNDIVSYDPSNHTMELTRRAYDRIQDIFPMPVKVDGIPFVVCAGEERIYAGAFWTPLSSLSYDGVIIMQPLDPEGTTIRISLGYPAPETFTGEDPRGDPRIHLALEREEKLK